MRGDRFDRILAGTALTLVLTLASAHAQPDLLEARMPLPEQTTLPPPTASDVTGITSNSSATPNQAAPSQATPSDSAVAAPEAAPDPLASLDPADRPIAEKMRDLLTAKVDRIFPNRKERSVVETFYQNHNFAPLWFEHGVVNARAKAAIERLRVADADGLDLKDYKLPSFDAVGADALAEAELKFTVTVLTFARHLQAGRFPQSRVGKDIEMPQVPPDPAVVLTSISDASDLAKALDAFSPPHEGYRRLKAKLAELRGTNGPEEEKFVRIPEGPSVKPGGNDARIPLLRTRLNVVGEDDSLRYDNDLVAAVKAFQKANGLKADGNLTPATVDALNGVHSGSEVDTIVANLERLRWLPRDLGRTYVMVNIPDYTLRVVRDHSLVWQTRIVVGQPHKQTPLISAEMKFITVNPTWNVPPSIIQNEYLPALRNDPDAMTRIGLKVTYNPDGSVHISQPPGERNALGRIRFNFPNKFLVYQHDTPDKKLFAYDKRAFSHGCMRVQDPVKYAEVLLGLQLPHEGYTQDRIRKMYGNAEIDIKFPTFLPVHLTYQTAYVDDAGKLVIREDVYGIDAKVRTAMRGDHRVAETSPGEPRRESYRAARMAKRQDGRQAAQGPFSFFGRLFQ